MKKISNSSHEILIDCSGMVHNVMIFKCMVLINPKHLHIVLILW